MDHLRQLSARYNAVWMETSQLYETWARRRGLSFYELLVVLSITETEEAVFQKDSCRRFTIPKQTVHAIIKTLADKGWLELEVSNRTEGAGNSVWRLKGENRRHKSSNRFRSMRRGYGSGWRWTGRNS
ncbi:MAG: MarR family transcriptional regulator [Evtepia gabavorous]